MPVLSGWRGCALSGNRSQTTTLRWLRGFGSSDRCASGPDSWAVRRRHYASLFEGESVAFALIAEADDAAVGYAMVDLRGPEESWDTGPVAVLETLAVLPDHRGSGIGTALIEAVFSELRTRGIGHWEVATIATNADAIRFYERLDLLPFTVNFIGRVPVGTDRAE